MNKYIYIYIYIYILPIQWQVSGNGLYDYSLALGVELIWIFCLRFECLTHTKHETSEPCLLPTSWVPVIAHQLGSCYCPPA